MVRDGSRQGWPTVGALAYHREGVFSLSGSLLIECSLEFRLSAGIASVLSDHTVL